MRIKFLILLIFSISSYGQNFNLSDGKIQWQKVYDSDLSKDQVKELLQKDPVLTHIAVNFSGTAKPQALNCEENQAIYMRQALQFFASIDFKEGRYRVTVQDIAFIPDATVELYGVETTTNPDAWEDYALKNSGEWRSNRLAKKSRDCINNYLNYLFTFKVSKSDW